MSTIAVLPVKRFEQAKQRLMQAVGQGHRRALVEAMLSDTLLALRRVRAIDQTIVVTAERAAARIAEGHEALVVDDTATSHSEAALLGVSQARELGAGRVLLVPGDCPLIDPAELEQLLARAAPARSVLIVPDRHGEGTNALLLTPPEVITPAFGDGSRHRHAALAVNEGATADVVALPSLALDIDTPDDLDTLVSTLAHTRGRAAHTRGMLSQLTRTHA